MKIKLYQVSNGNCPYLDNKDWETYAFEVPSIEKKLYEQLMNNGFRRSGSMLYKNCCKECNACIPIRTEVEQFQPSKSQKRILKKNQDIRIELAPASFDETSFNLYQKFSLKRFQTEADESSYRHFLLDSPLETLMMKYFLEKDLVGVGWIDMLESCISSVYFIFDPDLSKRSLGTFSILKEIELAKKMGKSFLYLGFYVKECKAMSYKVNFRPATLLAGDRWELPNV